MVIISMDLIRFIPSKLFQIFRRNNNAENRPDATRRQREQSQEATEILNKSSCSLLRKYQRERQGVNLIRVERSATIGLLIYDKDTYSNYIRWSICNCDSLQAAIEFLKSPHLTEELNDSDVVSEIKFSINPDNIRGLNSYEMWELGGRFNNKSIVLLFSSRINNCHYLYWKCKDNQQMINLMPYNEKFLSKDYKICYFVIDFLSQSLKNGHLGIDESLHPQNETARIQLHQLFDCRGYNLMMLAAEKGNKDVIKLLLKCGIATDLPNRSVNAQILAYKNRRFEILLIFLEMNLTFPPGMDVLQCSHEEFKNFCEITRELHEAVVAGNAMKVEEILLKNPKICHFYNFSNESALKIAYNHKQIAIINILVKHGMTFGPHEDTKKIFESFSDKENKIFTKIYSTNSKNIPEQHMNILIANSIAIGSETEHSSKIKEAFKSLNDYVLIKIILIMIAATKKFRIVFDFSLDCIQQDDLSISSQGPDSSRILIAAAKFLDPLSEHEGLGILAHVLCRYAMNLTFQNSHKPYTKNDKQTKLDFENINQECKRMYGYEEVIDQVYGSYPENMYHAELIACVPQLLMLYSSNKEKLTKIQNKFKLLFEFYDRIVVPAMKKRVPYIKANADFEIEPEEANVVSKFGNSDISVILAVILMALIGAAGFLAFMPDSTTVKNYNFSTLSQLEQSKVENAIVSYKNVNVKFQYLFPEDSRAFYKLKSSHIDMILNNKVLNLSSPNLQYLSQYIIHDWKNLTSTLKEKFLSSTCSFQNETVKFQDLYDMHPLAFTAQTSQQITDVLDGKVMTVGKLPVPSTTFNHHRKFISENTYLLYFKFLNNHPNSTFKEFYEKFSGESYEFFEKIYKEFDDKNSGSINIANSQLRTITAEYFVHRDYSELIHKLKSKKFLILASEMSTENTVTFEQMTKNIKRMFPTHWVLYVDVQKYAKVYKHEEFDHNELFIEILAQFTQNEFEAHLFKDSLASGNSIFLWNDVEEVAKPFDSSILDILRNFYKNSENLQLVSTTPEYSNLLRKEFRAEVYTLAPLYENDHVEMFRILLMSKHMKRKNKNNVLPFDRALNLPEWTKIR